MTQSIPAPARGGGGHIAVPNIDGALWVPGREALLELRDQQRIDDIVLRQVQALLDIEEVRLAST